MEKAYDCYLANNLGFSELGRYLLGRLILPSLEQEIGLSVFEPFRGCAVELQPHLDYPFEGSYREIESFFRKMNGEIAACNMRAIKRSRLFLAVLDGHDIGVAWECGYWTALKRGPIYAVQTDSRPHENLATTTNSMITGGIIRIGGVFFEGTNALGRWFDAIDAWQRRRPAEEKGGDHDPCETASPAPGSGRT